MCTAVCYRKRNFYFGRTLDYDRSFGEEVVIVPRNMLLQFREAETLQQHHAIIGMAHVAKGYPLFYDAVNEKGLAMAGLNFVGYADYSPARLGRDNIAHFELIPWILGQCDSVDQTVDLLEKLNITDEAFNEEFVPAQLHWLIGDRERSIVLESTKHGIQVYPNPVGVLTNNPPFDEQLFQLNNYMHLSPKSPVNRFVPGLELREYSRGMGALGLPGDFSSQSRFVRGAFVNGNSVSGDSEDACVSQFFHILDSVAQPRGCCEVGEGYEITIYSSCCNADRGIYYYTTYDNRGITAVALHRENLDAEVLIRYPLILQPQILLQNNQ